MNVFFSSRRRHTRYWRDWSSDVCSSDLVLVNAKVPNNMKDIHEKDEKIAEEIKKIEEQLNGSGRVLIRPSGTEPLVRVMLEGKDQAELDKIAHALAKMIEEKANA